MAKKVLVVAAHADDEVLGCGGTIAKHVENGDSVYTIFLTDGVTSRTNIDGDSLMERKFAAEQARQILRIQENFYLDLPDNRLDSIPLIEVTQHIERIILEISPDTIYTHYHNDLNVDHRIAHQSVITACRPIPGSSIREIYAFEVMSSTEWTNSLIPNFSPNHYVDISNQIFKKIEALKAYKIEMREQPHSRSLEHIEYLARHRGFSVGVMAAEAFVTIRTIK
jgi:LmbE family N-acetylglucosaminyl deacetylase